MYKIPENFNLECLKDSLITQITFGLNVIVLSYNNGFIQITGRFSIFSSGKLKNHDEVFPVRSDFGLLEILEKKILDVSINNSREELSIEFENGVILYLIGQEFFESYVVNINGNEFRV